MPTVAALARRLAAAMHKRSAMDEAGRIRIAVPLYRGLSREEALHLRFGFDGAPRGAVLVFVESALPEADGSPYDWDEIRGTPAWDAAWDAEREALRRLPR